MKAFKAKRDEKEVKAALDRIRETCRHGDPGSKAGEAGGGYPASSASLGMDKHNVMPALVNAALHNCTLGEMVQAMADVYGRYSGGPEW